jgi:hypothetical protein
MIDLVWLFFLFILVVVLALVALIGNTGEKPVWWASISVIFGIIHAWLLSTWANFIILIWIPAWEVALGLRLFGLYEFSAFLLLFSMAFFVLMSFRTAVIMWNMEGRIKLQA